MDFSYFKEIHDSWNQQRKTRIPIINLSGETGEIRVAELRKPFDCHLGFHKV